MPNLKTENAKTKNIVWAVDPTQEDHNLPQALELLRHWSTKLHLKVQPISVFSQTLFNLPVEYSLTGIEQNAEFAHKLTTRFLKEIKATDFLPPKLLYIASNSHRQAAITVAEYALKVQAPLIMVNSGMTPRWHLFSRIGFTETLITASRVPILAINPQTQISTATKSVLFPTDFSYESKVAFLNLQPWLQQHDASVILYNQIETPNLNFTVFDGGWMNLNVEQIIQEIEKSRLKISQEWKELIQSYNVKASIIIERQNRGLEADILALATKQNVDLIALVNHAGTWKQTLLGSVAREVVARSHCPVLVFHDPIPQQEKSESPKEEREPRISHSENLSHYQ